MKLPLLLASFALFLLPADFFETSYVDRNNRTQTIHTDCTGPPPLNETLCAQKHERRVRKMERIFPPRLPPPIKERTR